MTVALLPLLFPAPAKTAPGDGGPVDVAAGSSRLDGSRFISATVPSDAKGTSTTVVLSTPTDEAAPGTTATAEATGGVPDAASHADADVDAPATTTTTEPPPTTTTTRPPPPPPPTTTTAPPPPPPSPEAQRSGNSQEGKASWYDHEPGICAHKTLPFGTVVTVTNTDNGRSTTCTVGDRGPFVDGWIIDLNPREFEQLAPLDEGVIPVRITW